MSEFEDTTEHEVPIAGRLEGIGLPDLIYELGQAGMTGTLRIERMPIQRMLFFRAGRIVFASSTDPNDRLGEMLLRKNGITIDQLESALAQSGTGKRADLRRLGGRDSGFRLPGKTGGKGLPFFRGPR